MTIEDYDIGDRPTVTATFAPLEGEDDPLSIDGFFLVLDPAGTRTVYEFTDPEVTEVSTLVYKLQMPVLDQSGRWTVRSVGTEGIDAGEEIVLTVAKSRIPNPLNT